MTMRPVLFPLVFACAAWAQDLDRFCDEVRPTPGEERWRLAGFETSLVVAFKRAKAENKPVYYFAADGVLDSGNC